MCVCVCVCVSSYYSMLLLYLRHTTYCFTYAFGGAQTCERERELDPSHGLALEWLRGREVEERVGAGVSRSAGGG
jgi:hypothetical protein